MKMRHAICAVSTGILTLALAAIIGCPGNGMGNGDGNGGGGGDGMNGGTAGGVGTMQPADDLWTTPPGSATSYSFTESPLPADFFGEGSDPFDGTVNFQGAPIDPDQFGPADTIVRRMEDICPDDKGESFTVPVQMVALSLVSVERIMVTFDGGQNPEPWDVSVCLSSADQPMGSMTITLEDDDCGTFDSNIPVIPRFTFTRRSTSAGQFVDCGEPGQICTQLDLMGSSNGWALIDGGGGYNPDDNGIVRVTQGISIDRDCDGMPDDTTAGPSSCFQPGVMCDDGGFQCAFNEEAEGRLGDGSGARHESFMNSENDRDNDGWPNDCDNCPDDASADQTDTDGDGRGDICDNCPEDDNPGQEDADNDDVGDVCDNCPNTPNADQADGDDNGVGDACEQGGNSWQAVLGNYG